MVLKSRLPHRVIYTAVPVSVSLRFSPQTPQGYYHLFPIYYVSQSRHIQPKNLKDINFFLSDVQFAGNQFCDCIKQLLIGGA